MEIMKSFTVKDLVGRFKAYPSDLVGVDVGASAVKAVRMKKEGDKVTVLGVEILPPPKLIIADASTSGDSEKQSDKTDREKEPGASVEDSDREMIMLSAKTKGRYASIAVTGDNAIVKLVSFPGPFDAAAEEKVISNVGIEDIRKHRIGYKPIVEGRGKSESKVIVAVLPERDAALGAKFFPKGLPAPYSLELSGMACMNSFQYGPGKAYENEAVGALDFGTNTSTFALFNKGMLALIRRFDFGTNDVAEKVQEMLGVDRETARGIINDGAFDISQAVGDVMEPVVKQIVVSRDFVERRENCRIGTLYVCGGLVASKNTLDELKSAIGLEIKTWDPFEGLAMAPGAIPPEYEGQKWRFAAAVGACLATFEEA